MAEQVSRVPPKRGPGRPRLERTTPPPGRVFRLEDDQELMVEPIDPKATRFLVTFPDGQQMEMAAQTLWLTYEIKFEEV